jgi:molybdopterin/thiamine biosynthesis adenylyltransferase
VGLGSVGSIVAECLARSGFERFVLIDFDEVEAHNLDRLAGATPDDIGRLKVEVAESHIERCHTASEIDVRVVPYSLAEEPGYRAALDCDVLFSCVDRPRARQILNHFAYAHLIPVIDGGIQVRFKSGMFSGADWQVQTVGPHRACLQCLGAFDPSDADTERAGMLDDPSYMQGLPANHRFKANENVFPFSMNLASLEVMHLVAVATGAGRQDDFGVQRFRYMPGVLEQDDSTTCLPTCDMSELVARGDSLFCLAGTDPAAERMRRRRSARLSDTEPSLP